MVEDRKLHTNRQCQLLGEYMFSIIDNCEFFLEKKKEKKIYLGTKKKMCCQEPMVIMWLSLRGGYMIVRRKYKTDTIL